ncbi:MAG TPA: hypothetical protein VK165_14010 [Azonexus sp.]|nr:hypothetical protein [Azonexus sp.]
MPNNQCGRSIAIWGEAPQGAAVSPDKKLNVHFNYWHSRSQRSKKKGSADFLDIGLMAYDCAGLSRLRVYVPLALTIDDIEDLGGLFREPVVASIVFNESVSTTNAHNSNYITLQVAANSVYARVYVFSKDAKGTPLNSELSVMPDGEGTLIDICQSAIANGYTGLAAGKPLYFRLRIRLQAKGNTAFSRTTKPADGWLLSSFDYTEFLDFRLNEARNLPQNAIQKMWPGGQPHPGTPSISRVDFLVIVGDSADVAEGVECDKKRLLEGELWGTYTKTPKGWQQNLSNGMVIYHWKKPAKPPAVDIGDFSAFIKLKIRRSSWSLVWRYLLVVALIGSPGSLLVNFVWSGFNMESWVKPAGAKAAEPLEAPQAASPPSPDHGGRKDNNGRSLAVKGSKSLEIGKGAGAPATLEKTQ